MALFSKKQTVQPRRRRQSGVQPAPRVESPFRRGKTLTGSTSVHVKQMTAVEGSTQFKSPRAKVHELAAKRRRIGGLLLLVLAASAALYGLVSQFTASSAVRATEGISLASSEPYEQAIQEYFAQHPAERLRFLLNEATLTEFLQTKTPEVAEVVLQGSAGFGASTFQLTMRQPIVGWNIGSEKLFVDAAGVAFKKNYFENPKVQVIDQSGIPLESGRAVTSDRFLGFVGLAVGLTETNGYKVKEVILPRDTTREIELRLDNVAYPINLSVDRPAGEQVEDMARAVKWLHASGKNPKYVDVRVSGKAFYRE